MDLKEARKLLELKNLKEQQIEQEIAEIKALQRMPFYLMIQEEGQEEKLKRVEASQLQAMKHQVYKYYHKERAQYKALWAEFMTEYLSGQCPNIVTFLKDRFGEPKESST